MELRGCRPLALAELAPEALTAESVSLADEPDAVAVVSFGFLEGVFEACFGVEPNMSKSVLWRFPFVVLAAVDGVSFGVVPLSSRSGLDTDADETFSSVEATGA